MCELRAFSIVNYFVDQCCIEKVACQLFSVFSWFVRL
jgi:hypothetical protein